MSTYHEQSGMPIFILTIFILQMALFGVLYLKTSSSFYIGVMGAIILVGLLLFLTRLNISVSHTAISYQFFPFVWKTRIIKWADIEKAEVIKLSALSDFSGWGLRYSKSLGWGYITSTNFGLRLKKSDGSQIVLSLRHKDEFINFLSREDLIKNIPIYI
jgi:hypothetical protein